MSTNSNTDVGIQQTRTVVPSLGCLMDHSVKNNSNGGLLCIYITQNAPTRLYYFYLSPHFLTQGQGTSSLSPNLINLSYNLTNQYILFVSAYFSHFNSFEKFARFSSSKMFTNFLKELGYKFKLVSI